ncbi:MAG: peptidoglycan editing factor PgeF [Phycisphaeraceae bacterium]
MLERIDHSNGVVTYQSPRLRAAGVVHAFTTRLGGVSQGPYASLNLGPLVKGDDADANTAVAENFRLLRGALGREQSRRVVVRQVHGSATWRAPSSPLRPEDAPDADAIVSTEPAHLVTIRVADCVPILLASHDGRAVAGGRAGGGGAAAHAGWRGLVAGVIPNTVAHLLQIAGDRAEDVVVAVGPHIRPAAYEVGPEVVEAFEAAGLGSAVVRRPDGASAVDLLEAAMLQLDAVGVDRASVDCAPALCTSARAEVFFSHRRDRGRTGRLAAVISPTAR